MYGCKIPSHTENIGLTHIPWSLQHLPWSWPWKQQSNLLTRHWLMMMYYQTEFGCERISSSAGMVDQVIFWSYQPLIGWLGKRVNGDNDHLPFMAFGLEKQHFTCFGESVNGDNDRLLFIAFGLEKQTNILPGLENRSMASWRKLPLMRPSSRSNRCL